MFARENWHGACCGRANRFAEHCGTSGIRSNESPDQRPRETSGLDRKNHGQGHPISGCGARSAADTARGDCAGCVPGKLLWARWNVWIEGRSGARQCRRAQDEAVATALGSFSRADWSDFRGPLGKFGTEENSGLQTRKWRTSRPPATPQRGGLQKLVLCSENPLLRGGVAGGGEVCHFRICKPEFSSVPNFHFCHRLRFHRRAQPIPFGDPEKGGASQFQQSCGFPPIPARCGKRPDTEVPRDFMHDLIIVSRSGVRRNRFSQKPFFEIVQFITSPAQL